MTLLVAVLVALLSSPAATPYAALKAVTDLQQQTVRAAQANRVSPDAVRAVVWATAGSARALTSAMLTNISGAIYDAKREALLTIRASHADWSPDALKRSGLGKAFADAETALAAP